MNKLNNLNVLLWFTAITLITLSCNENANKVTVEKAQVEQQYLTVKEITERGDELANKTVHVQGIIEHVCKHTWRRFKVVDNGGTTELKVELDENFATIDASLVGNTVKVSGKLVPFHLNAEKVLEWQKKMQENHKGEEHTAHYKEEQAMIQNIYNQITDGTIAHYTMYSIMAEKYTLD